MGWLKKRVTFPQGGGGLPYKSDSDAHRKIKIKLKEDYYDVGVAQS